MPHDLLRQPLMRHLIPIPNTSLLRLDPQPISNLLHTTSPPGIEALGMQHSVFLSGDKCLRARGCLGGNDVDLIGQLPAEFLERQIVDIVAEGVFNFAADGGDAEDDVCANYKILELV